MGDINATVDTSKHGAMYRFLYFLCRYSLWAFFREHHVVDNGKVPVTGPVLVVSNHANMVVDPAILIATFPHRRQVHFWALAKFFKNRITRAILTSAGVVPVQSQSKDHTKLFQSTWESLEKGEVVGLFPEGTSYTAPHILPLKDGVSWAALGYMKRIIESNLSNKKAPVIIPAGITYANKSKYRSTAIIEYGDPIFIEPYVEDFLRDPKPAVKRLTKEIQEAIERITVNAPDWETERAMRTARNVLFTGSNSIRTVDYVKIMQSFANIFTKCKDDPSVERLRSVLLEYSHTLDSLRLSNLEVSSYHKISILSATFRLVRVFLAFSLGLPLFLPGLLVHAPFYLAGKWAERKEVYLEQVAQDKIFTALGLTPFVYGTFFWLVWRITGYSTFGLAFALLLIPSFAWYHILLVDDRYDMFKNLVASWRLFASVSGWESGTKHEVDQLVRLRRECSELLRSVLWNLADVHHQPDASYLVEYAKPLFSQGNGRASPSLESEDSIKRSMENDKDK
ncbi:uncharacterized protein VTP21DRAFT_5683 [Calcarisporiella thermophila]|uniref:uncharacterized protein n=1 Tax=Calcarisporiella thermophila TaxID=911321 RepID=UPI00374423D2